MAASTAGLRGRQRPHPYRFTPSRGSAATATAAKGARCKTGVATLTTAALF